MAEIVFANNSREIPPGVNLVTTFEGLSEAIAGERHLLPQTPEALMVQLEAGLSCLGFSANGLLLAHTTIWKICEYEGANWYELGTTWVCPSMRGQGLNHLLYRAFLPLHQHRNILATTTNVASRAVGRDLHFIEVPRRALPEPVWRASCSCSRKKMGTPDPASCLLAWSEEQNTGRDVTCWFRVTPETAGRLEGINRGGG